MRDRIASASILATLLAVACERVQPSRLPLPNPGKLAWRSIGPGQFGAMFGVAISPHDSKVIVAGVDMGNAFMTRDGGRSWKIIGRCRGEPFANPGYRGTWGVCFDPKRPERIWIGSEHGLYLTTDGCENWRMVLGGDAGYIVHAIATDPTDSDIVYAASGRAGRGGVSWSKGNVWKSVDGGGTWRVTRPGGPRERDTIKNRNWVTIAVDSQSSFTPGKGHGRVYICGQGGFFVSEDAGETWRSLEEFLPGGVVDLDLKGVHTSGICDMVLVPGEGRSTIFATIQARHTDPERRQWLGGVYASRDGGRTWAEKNRGLERALTTMVRGRFRYSLIVGCRTQPKVMYWGARSGVFKTTDGGESWRKVTFLGTEWKKRPDFDGKKVNWLLRRHEGNFDQSYYNAYGPANGLACSPTDPDAVSYTDNAGIAVSFDGGEHWTEPGFEFGKAVRPGEFGDRPPMRLTHKVRSRGIQLIVPFDVAVDPFDPKTIAIGHADVGLTISRDGGTWWEWAYHGILKGERNYIRAVLYDPDVKGRLWVAGGGWGRSGHVYLSEDGGRTFKVVGISQMTAEAELLRKKPYYAVRSLALDPGSPKDARTIYAGTDLGLYKTTDGGRTWDGSATGLESVPGILHVLVDPTSPTRLYAAATSDSGQGAEAGLYRSEDAGRSWVRLAPDKIPAAKSISVCNATGTLYVLAHRPGENHRSYWARRALWRTDDSGETWEKVDDRRGACVAVHPRDPDRVYFVTFAQDVRKENVNVYRSTDGGKSWEAIADDIPLSPGGFGGYGNRIIFGPGNPSRLFLLHNSGTYEGIER